MDIMEKVKIAFDQESCVVCTYKDGMTSVEVTGNVIWINDDNTEFEVLTPDNVSHVIREFEVIMLTF